MLRAVFKNGAIIPVDPLPLDWVEGQELRIEADGTEDVERGDFDAWFREPEEMASQNDPADVAQIERTLRESRERAKADMRKETGLS